MNKLFTEINNCYTLKFPIVYIKFKKIYINILNKMFKLGLINSFKVSKYKVIINLKYFRNKPLFFFKNHYTSGNFSNLKYINIRRNIKLSGGLKLYLTNKGILTLEELVINKVGGKLLVHIGFIGKNIM